MSTYNQENNRNTNTSKKPSSAPTNKSAKVTVAGKHTKGDQGDKGGKGGKGGCGSC